MDGAVAVKVEALKIASVDPMHIRQVSWAVGPKEPAMVEVYQYLPRLGALPLYVIQSTHDGYLPADKARALFGPDTERRRFQPIESTNHNFSDKRDEMYAAAREALLFIERFMAK